MHPIPMTTDIPEEETAEALAIALKGGDEGALRGLMDLFGQGVLSYVVRHVGDLEDARELTQEVFVRVFRSIGRWEPRAPFRSWLFRIALNLCRDHARSRRTKERRATGPLEWVDAGALVSGDDDVVEVREEMGRLMGLIGELPAKLREPLVLNVLEGHSAEEAAAVLEISVRAVETRVYRARRMLRGLWDGGMAG